jgi:hypothetical protein
MPLILAIAVIILLLWAVSAFSKADPGQVRRLLRTMGGAAALALAVFVLARGEIAPAIVAGVVGVALLGWISPKPAGALGRWLKGLRPSSQARTACLEMELSHLTGAMQGTVLAGRHEGASLDALDLKTLLSLFDEFDRDSGDLLAAYLDRREPGWRQHAERDAAARGGARSRATARAGKMSEEEAYKVLGIQAGSSAQEISRAHRSLMKKLHPDQGGSTDLAARVNEAKEVLLRRHR